VSDCEVTKIWCEGIGGTKLRENNLKATNTNYYEIHAINSDKAIGQYISTG